LKRMKFSEPPSFKKKGHEVQYKHNERTNPNYEGLDEDGDPNQGHILRNNKTALENESFVTEAITDLLACQSIAMVDLPPLVVNPLSVATNARGFHTSTLEVLSERCPKKAQKFIYASDQGYGGYAISNHQTLVCQGHWLESERGTSSTWRELKALGASTGSFNSGGM
ncbi:Hypothetical predicted protein, partial [Paramuricea clavata]